MNQAKAPVLIAETKETLDIISFSYQLEATIKIQFLPQTNLSQLINSCENVFLFNPSTSWQSQLNQQFKLKRVYKPNLLTSDEIALTLWTVEGFSNNCL